jgi:hypothetical protein
VSDVLNRSDAWRSGLQASEIEACGIFMLSALTWAGCTGLGFAGYITLGVQHEATLLSSCKPFVVNA